MSTINARAFLRNQIRAIQRGQAAADTAGAAPEQVTRFGLDALDGAENAKKARKALKFELYCGIDSRTGIASFYAQLAGGKSFAVTPVMPKDIMGNPLDQPNVFNGSHGYLTLLISENAQVEENSRGQRTLTVRPEFVGFSKSLEEALALEKEPAEKKEPAAAPQKK